MAVGFDAVGPNSSGATSSSSTTLSWSHTVGASGTYLLVGATCDASTDTGLSMTAKYNGVLMTSLGVVHTNNSTAGFLQVWGMANPPTGSALTVLVTVAGGTPLTIDGGSVSFTGAGSLSATQTAANTGTTASLAFTPTVVGNMVAAFCGCGSALTPTGSFTSRYNGGVANAGAGFSAGSTLASTGSSMTASWTSASDFWAVIAVEVQATAAAGGGVPQAQPGQTWLRRFHHRQQPQPALAAQAAPAVAGTAPLHLVIARRAAARGYWRGFVSSTTNLLNGTPPDHLVIARRTAARGQWQGYVSRTTNLLNGDQPGGVICRRRPARGQWRGPAAVTTVNAPPAAAAGTAPLHLTVARRATARAAWRGGAVPPRQPAPAAGGLIVHRRPGRPIWGGAYTPPVNAIPPAGTAPLHLVVSRRAAARAAWRGFVSRTVNAAVSQPGNGATQPHLVIARRTAARAVVRFTPVPGAPAIPVAAAYQAPPVAGRRPVSGVAWAGPTVPRAAGVAPLLANTAEGGTSGTTVSNGNSGGASGNAWDTVSIGSSATFTFDNAQAAHGALSYKVTTPATATTSFAYWGSSLGAGNAQVWFRAYLYFAALPGANHRVLTVWNTTTATSICASVQLVAATGALRFLNAAGSTIFTTTATIPLNQWFRIEGYVIGSATVGQVELKLFKTADSTVPDETDTSAATQNTTGTIGSAGFGVSAAVSSASFWMDDLGVSAAGYMGPSVASAGTLVPGAAIPASRQVPSGRWGGTTAVTVNGPAVPAVAVLAPLQLPPVPRRRPARAVWHPTGTATTNLLAGNQPGGLIRRRATARAVVRGGPAPFPPPSGTTPDHLVIARRSPARAVWRGYISSTTNLLAGNQPGAGLVKRRAAARAVWAGTVTRTVNVTPTVSGAAPDHLVIARRAAARGVWHGTTARTTNLLAGNQPGGLIRRRATARVVWAGTAVRTVNVVPTVSGTPPDHLVVARRASARAVVHGTVSATVNAQAPAPAPAQRVIIPRRAPARAVARGNPVPGQPSRPATGGLVRRRAPARGQWHGGAGQPPAPPGGTPALGGRVVTRRPPSRGQWHGTTVRTTNPIPIAVPAPRARAGLPRRAAARAVWRGGAGAARPSLRIIFAATGARQPWQATGARQTWQTGTARQTWQAGEARQLWETGTARQLWRPGQARNSG